MKDTNQRVDAILDVAAGNSDMNAWTMFSDLVIAAVMTASDSFKAAGETDPLKLRKEFMLKCVDIFDIVHDNNERSVNNE